MTTKDFIGKTYNTTSTRERWCSSVFTDYEGTVYSYGYHYPLAFHVKGLDFINTRGYSNTTARHILWAKQALDYQYIGVELERHDVDSMRYASDDDKLAIILEALKRQEAELKDEMSSKTRKDTQVYRSLQDREDTIAGYINKVVEVMA